MRVFHKKVGTHNAAHSQSLSVYFLPLHLKRDLFSLQISPEQLAESEFVALHQRSRWAEPLQANTSEHMSPSVRIPLVTALAQAIPLNNT